MEEFFNINSIRENFNNEVSKPIIQIAESQIGKILQDKEKISSIINMFNKKLKSLNDLFKCFDGFLVKSKNFINDINSKEWNNSLRDISNICSEYDEFTKNYKDEFVIAGYGTFIEILKFREVNSEIFIKLTTTMKSYLNEININIQNNVLDNKPETNPNIKNSSKGAIQITRKEKFIPDLNENSFKSVFEKYKIKPTRPFDKIYRPELPVKYCSFCNLSSKKTSKLGPLYGPFLSSDNTNNYFSHEKCILYCKESFLDDTNRLTNVQSVIEESLKLKCKFCKKVGAAIRCSSSTCKAFYHFKCALKNDLYLDNSTYETLCNKHGGNRISKVDTGNKCSVCLSLLDQDLMKKCSECNEYYHVYCCSPMIESLKDDWCCKECKVSINH